jgi:hypothetical protein
MTALACLLALCLTPTLSAQDALDQHPPVDPKAPQDACRMAGLVVGLGHTPQMGTYAALSGLFVSEPRELTNTCRMAGLGVGTGGRQGGCFRVLAALLAGRDIRWGAWDAILPLHNRYNRIWLGATTLYCNGLGVHDLGGALRELATVLTAQYALCWRARDTDVFVPIPERYLRLIADGPVAGAGNLEVDAYTAFVVHARFTSDKAFASAVRHDVTAVHLMESPSKYRGEVVRVTGHLRRINRYAPPPEADGAGVRDLYEAWIASDSASQLYCVIFTDWPDGLPKEYLGQQKISGAPIVTADGYFFKKYKYRSVDPTSKDSEAPLVIGHTIRFEGTAPAADTTTPSWLTAAVAFLGGIIVFMLATVIGLSWWWRRSDDRTRKRLQAARSPEFILPPPETPPALAVAVPVARSDEKAPPRFSFPPGLGERPGESGPPARSGDRGSTEEEPPEDAGA